MSLSKGISIFDGRKVASATGDSLNIALLSAILHCFSQKGAHAWENEDP